ncbi:MAG: monovalent cation/H+ antiporter subunit D family protein [Dehalococcoidia bacterium]|nr:monovalent cation/H+ antiporter subunit D family protein [Dehalococcoidia bacterium]MDW8119796.1 proton-conducting transporter membrane subunit [Chloroflexota bacterium]
METLVHWGPLLAVLISLGAAGLIVLSGRNPNLREAWTLLAAGGKLAILLAMLPTVLKEGATPLLSTLELAPGLSLALHADALGMLFGLSASFLWVLTSFYSIGYMRGLGEHKQTRYFASFAVCLSATMGIAFAGNLLTLLVFYEVLTIATYPLVIHKETPEAMAAGRKYLVYLLTAGVVLLLGVAWTVALAGTGTFTPGGFLEGKASPTVLLVLFLLFFLGFGVKAAVMPLHSWLPAAMVAPTPVSALLHAVAVVKAGVFGIARTVGFVFGPPVVEAVGAVPVASALAGATLVTASVLALRQDSIKLRLAYSTVGHLSYAVLGLVLLVPSGWTGGLFHMVSHAAMKITLFFVAGAIYVKTHVERVSDLDGLGRQMPWTLGAFAVASVGLAGLPPVAGFVSKWFLALGTLDSGYAVYLALLMVSGLLNAAYLFPIPVRGFLRPAGHSARRDEANPLLLVPVLLACALSVILGLAPNIPFPLFTLVERATTAVLNGGGP